MIKYIGLAVMLLFAASCASTNNNIAGGTPLTMEILTARPWQILEIRGVIGNNTYHYLRGGGHNTESFDFENIVFNADGSGTYFDNGGTGTPLTWDFEDAAHTRLHYIVPFPSGKIIANWEHIVYSNGVIRYAEYFKDGYNNSHSEGIRAYKY